MYADDIVSHKTGKYSPKLTSEILSNHRCGSNDNCYSRIVSFLTSYHARKALKSVFNSLLKFKNSVFGIQLTHQKENKNYNPKTCAVGSCST